jgi:hypothetical protein
VPPPLDLSHGWTVRFGPTGAPITMDPLVSWTALTNEIHFSGLATYEQTVTIAPEMLQPGVSVAFDFGPATASPPGSEGQDGGARFRAALNPPVREAAILYLNGQRAGSVWCPPYAIDVTGKLKPGQNTFRIEVANLAVNYMAGIPLPNYDYAGVTREFGNRFAPQNLGLIRPQPAGLFGPLRLLATPATAR